MLSWYVKLPNEQMKRVTENDVNLYRDKLILNKGRNSVIFEALDETTNFLYGDVLFMCQTGNQLIPMELPCDVDLNLLEHPQIQEFITNTRKKLYTQIKKYEDVLENLKTTNFEEENFERQFFEEFQNLRNSLYQNSGNFLQERLNATNKELASLVESRSDKSIQESSQVNAFLRSPKRNSKGKKLKKKVNPNLKNLFSE